MISGDHNSLTVTWRGLLTTPKQQRVLLVQLSFYLFCGGEMNERLDERTLPV